MCGISGIWNLSGEGLSVDRLKTFTDSLSHRGPDGEGFYIDESANFGMGHRRLSILDLSAAGKQPMSFADERYWISYNGEIFNFLELRSELKGKGYSFKTETDTEVILAAYHCWGVEAFQKFNGMWAMAIWDSLEKKLFLSRDRFGIKPLFYTQIPGKMFAFASETYSFKCLEGYERKFSKRNVELQMKDTDTLEGLGYTIFDGIYQLLPGHYMFIDQKSRPMQKRWWNTLEHLVKIPSSYKDQVVVLRELLVDSLRLRLRSDVPVATALSGGVDSSSVACTLNYMMQHTASKERMPSDWQRAFVATFPGTDSDERIYAQQVIDQTRSKGTFITLNDLDLAGRIRETTLRSDSILGSPMISQYMIYESMKANGISVSMDGHGVDEMMYGYPWLVKAAYKHYAAEGDRAGMEDIENTYVDLFYEDNKGHAKERFREETIPLSAVQRIKKGIRKVAGEKLYSSLKGNTSVLPELSDKPYLPIGLNSAEQMLFHCFHTSTLPSILRNFDRASMQNSVEVRMPFMDWRLVSFIFSLPLSSKVGHGYTKRILRDAMKDIVPENIIRRKLKVGLMAPMYDWFNSKMSEMILDEVNSSSFVNSEFWDGKKLSVYATRKIKDKSWNAPECAEFWPLLNMHLLKRNNDK